MLENYKPEKIYSTSFPLYLTKLREDCSSAIFTTFDSPEICQVC